MSLPLATVRTLGSDDVIGELLDGRVRRGRLENFGAVSHDDEHTMKA
jgi:hypothetical protein